MSHEKLINLLNQYGTISEIEKLNIEKYFISAKIKKKQVLIEKYLPCNKLFFINNGLLRAYYIYDKGKEITRMFAWEGRFLTNISSFKMHSENSETIECIKNADILYINRNDFEVLIKSSHNIKNIYTNILEEYTALHIKRFEVLNTFNLEKKLLHLKNDFPNLTNELNDNLLASFLGISRIHFVNNKHLLYK